MIPGALISKESFGLAMARPAIRSRSPMRMSISPELLRFAERGNGASNASFPASFRGVRHAERHSF